MRSDVNYGHVRKIYSVAFAKTLCRHPFDVVVQMLYANINIIVSGNPAMPYSKLTSLGNKII